TPRTFNAAAGSKLRTRPPKYGERATSAVCRPGNCTSMPNPARPWTLAAESSRLCGLPMTVQADRSLRVTWAGGGRRDAASAGAGARGAGDHPALLAAAPRHGPAPLLRGGLDEQRARQRADLPVAIELRSDARRASGHLHAEGGVRVGRRGGRVLDAQLRPVE